MTRVWISLVEAYQTVRKSIISDCKKTQDQVTDAFYHGCEKVEKTDWFCYYIHILKAVHLQQLKGIQGSKLSV